MATMDPVKLQGPSEDGKQGKKSLVKGVATPEKAKLALNATKMLDSHGLKPVREDVERIINVLDETIAKLEMSSLIPHIIASLDRFAGVLGPELTNSLMEHKKLSAEMEQLLASSEEGAEVTAEERSCLCSEQHLKRSVRNVLRLLLAKPSLCQTLKSEAWTTETLAQGFIKAFKEFRNLMLERLLISPKEEEEKVQLMEIISLRINKDNETITGLKEELAAVIQTREEKLHKKDKVIEDLKATLEDLPKECKAFIQQIKQEAAKKQEEQLQASRAKCSRLQEDIQQLQTQLRALVLEHRASELTLQRRNYRMESEIANWIQKYKADMDEKQAEYEEVHAAYTEEEAQTSLLMEKHAVLLEEYSLILEERRIRQQKEEEALKELNTKILAATCIQAFWRGYLVRSFLKSLKKKKKKGKGKKAKK